MKQSNVPITYHPICEYMQNRELSWLKFNQRVLEEAADPAVPLMERLKFVSIFTSNLDEFFMIRVGSLFDMMSMGEDHRDSRTGMTDAQQLDAIYAAVTPLYDKKTQVYNEIRQGLAFHGVHALRYEQLESTEAKYVRDYYRANIAPILSPQVVDTHHPFPHIGNKEIHLIALLKQKGSGSILGILPVPRSLPEVLYLPGSEVRYIRMENILLNYMDGVFEGYDLTEKNILCVTRNGDINADDEAFDVVEDFRDRMKKLLHKRKRLSVVRLEANLPMSDKLTNLLCERLHIERFQIFITDTALKLGYAFGLESKFTPAQKGQLCYPAFKPAPNAGIDITGDILAQVRQKDQIFHYPFESMKGFLNMIKEASRDPEVISIKITIYRLAKKAKLVDYLCDAAENGKEVTVLMELRARFDEQNNIDWSEKLEDAGCKIIYGFDEYKVHSKVCLITYKDKNGGVGYITQVGTGNYNEKTAELYTDLSLVTANREIGTDAAEFFKNMAIGNVEGSYKHLLVAPMGLKPALLSAMDHQIAKGKDGRIRIKINSLVDTDFIHKLAQASQAGVQVDLIVRGICCLLPQVPNHTENITVISVVGRLLEHSRIYCFGKGAEETVYIASADLMTRNTERRVEVACPILDAVRKQEVVEIFDAIWADNIKARELLADATHCKRLELAQPVDCQREFIQDYANRTPPVRKPEKQSVFAKLAKLFQK